MSNDEIESIRTLVRTLDVRGLTPPDAEQAIRSGTRRRRIELVDRALAGGLVLALVAGGAIWVVGQSSKGRPAIVASSPAPRTTIATPSSQAPRSPVVTAKAGDVIDVGTTGKRLRLSATGFCEESAPHANVPLGPCRTDNDPNGMGYSSGGWDHVEVVTGITAKIATAVVVTRTDGRTFTGALVRIPGATWQAFYVVMPWKPGTVVDATHPAPRSDIARITSISDTGQPPVVIAP